MKLKTMFCLLAMIALLFSVNYAQLDSQDQLIIMNAQSAPTIDGVKDGVWKNSQRVLLDKFIPVDLGGYEQVPWLDHYGEFYTLWDDNNLYVFVDIWDDLTNPTGAGWDEDCVELCFDNDNSKESPGVFDVAEVAQYRFVRGAGSTVNANPNEAASFAQVEMADGLGYSMEIQLTLDGLMIDSSPGYEFGFEVHSADNDSDVPGRSSMIRWWDTNNDAWHDAALLGTAEISSLVAGSDISIYQAATAPTIDGVQDAVYKTAPMFGSSMWIPDVDQVNQLTSFKDCAFDFWTLWDDNNLYMFLNVWDDEIGNTGGGWNEDCIELCFDNDNSKESPGVFDVAEVAQYRFVRGAGTTVNANPNEAASYAQAEMADGLGYTMELQFSLDGLMIDSSPGYEFGIEVHMADCDDNAARSIMARWWDNNNDAWHDAALLATAMISTADGVGIDEPAAQSKKTTLSQNYPNPFNSKTMICYTLEKNSPVSLKVYDLLGRNVATLVDKAQPAGSYKVDFSASKVSSGIYFYVLKAGNQTETKKMSFIK